MTEPELRAELVEQLSELNHCITAVKVRHEANATLYPNIAISAYAAMDRNGRPLLADLLVAKSNVLLALSHLPPTSQVPASAD